MDKEKKKDKCVSCWKETKYDVDTPIELRVHYVETVGQLCESCFNEIYNKKEKD